MLGWAGPGPDEAARLPPAQPAHNWPASIMSPDCHQLTLIKMGSLIFTLLKAAVAPQITPPAAAA